MGLLISLGNLKDDVSTEMIFSRIGRKRNVVSWCSILAALVQNHEVESALMNLFKICLLNPLILRVELYSGLVGCTEKQICEKLQQNNYELNHVDSVATM
jgi:hypothetical protein